jgi:hypothetical protein
MSEPTKDEIVTQPVINEKLSRWWIICHLWGGVCLYIYLVASGTYQLILESQIVYDSESAVRIAGLIMLVTGLTGYLISRSLVRAIESGAMGNKGKLALKISLPILYFVGAVILAMATTPFISSTTGVSKISMLIACK